MAWPDAHGRPPYSRSERVRVAPVPKGHHVVVSEPPRPSYLRAAGAGGHRRAYALAVSAATPARGQAVGRIAARLETRRTTNWRTCATPSASVAVTWSTGSSPSERTAGRSWARCALWRPPGSPRDHCRNREGGEPTRFRAVFGPSVADLPWERLCTRRPVFADGAGHRRGGGTRRAGQFGPHRTAAGRTGPGGSVRRADRAGRSVGGPTGCAGLRWWLRTRRDRGRAGGRGRWGWRRDGGGRRHSDRTAVRRAGGAAATWLTGPGRQLATWTPPGSIGPDAFGRALAGRLVEEGIETSWTWPGRGGRRTGPSGRGVDGG